MHTKLMLIFPLMTFALSAAEHAQEVIRFKGADTIGINLSVTRWFTTK